jgi:hypothetical protein
MGMEEDMKRIFCFIFILASTSYCFASEEYERQLSRAIVTANGSSYELNQSGYSFHVVICDSLPAQEGQITRAINALRRAAEGGSTVSARVRVTDSKLCLVDAAIDSL